MAETPPTGDVQAFAASVASELRRLAAKWSQAPAGRVYEHVRQIVEERAASPADASGQTVHREPDITVNGTALSPGEAMTVRVALEHFAMDLAAGSLGDDEHGRTMTANYQRGIDAIRRLYLADCARPR